MTYPSPTFKGSPSWRGINFQMLKELTIVEVVHNHSQSIIDWQKIQERVFVVAQMFRSVLEIIKYRTNSQEY
jgi:hypothetical protein